MRALYLLMVAASCTGAWGQPATAPKDAPKAATPRPPLTIELGANQRTKADILAGMPLTITATLRNGPAVEVETAKAALESVKASIDAAVAGKTMEADEAAAFLAAHQPPPDAPPLTVRPLSARFRFTGPEGTALPWAPRMLEEKDEPTVLDGQHSLRLVFVASPEQTAALRPGEVRLVLHYDGQGAAAGDWPGEAASEAVTVRVVPPPPTLTPEQTWMRAYAFSEYHLATKEWPAAITDADGMIQAIATAPAGYLQLGRAREGAGNAQGALEAYEAAIEHYVALDPKGEPPFGVMGEVARLRKALGLELKVGP